MKRRVALQLIGAMVAVAGASKVQSKDGDVIDYTEWEIAPSFEFKQHPTDFIFIEGSMRNLIVRKTNGSDIIIPFSEIFEALENK